MPQDFIENQLFPGSGLAPFGDKPLPKPKLAKFYAMASLGHDESMSDVYTKYIYTNELLCEHRWCLDINAGCMHIKDECMKARALTLTAACCLAGRTEAVVPVP